MFCQSICIAGPAAAAERLILGEPTKGRPSGRLVLIAPAIGLFVLIAPLTGACKLMGPAAGTPIELGALARERGAVGSESLQERSPTVEASPKKIVSRVVTRIIIRLAGR